MNCPNCGNPLMDKGKYCPYCGSVVSDDVTVRIDSHREIVDHARIAEANVRGVKAKETTKRHRGLMIVAIIVILGILGLAAFRPVFFLQIDRLFGPKSDSLDDSIETMRLQRIEDEILEDIRNEKYDQALAKAQTLRYTIDYSPTAKREWDSKREDLIKTLEGLIKER